MRTPQVIQLYQEDQSAVRAELVHGLLADQAALSPKFFYDALGSRLFDAITQLPEYYPTRTEARIFERHAADMAAMIPSGLTLVDLGAGNCEKAGALLNLFQPARYVAVDMSVGFMAQALQRLQRQHQDLEMLGVGLDFSSDLTLPAQAGLGPRLVFYPGSSIGNFAPEPALAFLRRTRALAQEGALLIGVDLLKPVSVLVPAYDDALGVTAAFNRNMLLHVNRLLGSDFQPRQWQHRAVFNATEHCIEMHLVAERDQTVHWPGAQRGFRQGEHIHTENAYKYTLRQFEAVLREAGFSQVRHWQDAQGWFAVFLAHDSKENGR